ncbi:GTP hydrolase, accessory liganding Ni into hydrogenases, HypB [Psychromonas ingrahamii 37]|uniref:Hydrogenase maturation factor HypB n=1 Tax=Psychromonas ingrahamii (strain DSM 17664 / CCUG 51855 / 37) TaxID=357804 RepID=A1SU79_PSYIN|nr:hydrogenase nickel incorporation protein HypB [Psychromonas ingrahamii]ABM03044.1 GTP hydrolase, accessory liganding Ni into hydrogenases, HypB [Psychromonas ingrahamii 37]
MCKVCGCNQAEVTIEGPHDHHHHNHQHQDIEQHSSDILTSAASTPRMIEIEQNILSKNNYYAKLNREQWLANKIFSINLISSPGSGKTTLLIDIIKRIKEQHCIYVIEGDQQTSLDATRIRETGVQALQVNTGKGCHLDAHMVGHAAVHLGMQKNAFLFIENVGNLICPAGFDLGEAHKVVILSVTEGEDKPLKYPEIFHAADLMVINKIDLLPYVNFDLQQCSAYAKQINPEIKIIPLSATSGENMEQLKDWLIAGKAELQSG